MKQEIDPRNIHVFRVNRATTTRKKESQTSTKRTTTTSLLNSTAESTTAASSRTSLSAETKRSICEDHIENPKLTQEALASKYGCKRTTVAKIIKSKDRWISIDSEANIAKKFRQRNSRYPLVENALISWLEKEHRNDISIVTDQMLRSQARQYAQNLHMDGVAEFKASSSWVTNFKQRYMKPKSNSASPTTTLRKESSNLPITTSSSSLASESQTPPETTDNDLAQEGLNNFLANRRLVIAIAPNPTVAAVGRNNQAPANSIDSTLPSTNSDQSTISNPAQSVTETASDTIDQQEGDETYSRRETSSDTSVGRMDEDSDYDDHFDIMGHCNDIPPPCFDNNSAVISPSSANNTSNNNTHNSIEQQPDTNLLEKAQQSAVVDNVNTTLQLPQQQENTKLTAKQHLEAALAFYTSQNGSNASMSANMIKLILQNDF